MIKSTGLDYQMVKKTFVHFGLKDNKFPDKFILKIDTLQIYKY